MMMSEHGWDVSRDMADDAQAGNRHMTETPQAFAARLARELKKRADELDTEAASMRQRNLLEWRTPLGTLRDRDTLGFLAAEYRLLAVWMKL